MEGTSRERRLLARTQSLMVAVSLVPLCVLFYLAQAFVFPTLVEAGQQAAVLSIALTLAFTVIAVVLGYVLVRRDTVRTIGAVAEGERRLNALHEAAARVTEEPDADAVRAALLREAAALVEAERGALWEPEGANLRVVDAVGQSLERSREHAVPLGHGLVGGVAQSGAIARDAELAESDLRWDDRVMARTHSSLVVPVRRGGRVALVLDLRNRAGLGTRFSVLDAALVEALGRQAFVALDAARFREAQAAQAAQVERLVHDVTERTVAWPGHVTNVAALCARIAERLELADEAKELLRRAALVHDVGLFDVPRADIGPDGGPVDHAERGAERLAAMPLWAEVAPIVRLHHERMDGSGPLGLSGFAIPMPARILALAEHVDTATNPASPWSTRSAADVVAELRDEEDGRFDRRVVEAFLDGIG